MKNQNASAIDVVRDTLPVENTSIRVMKREVSGFLNAAVTDSRQDNE